MLMSKSRLEKFLYALYSLDSSDLSTPLSRIEELYNCWVTGADVPNVIKAQVVDILKDVLEVEELPEELL